MPTQRLMAIMKKLRDPERGCPWDLEQTFSSLAPHTLEETWEVLDAIEREDADDLRDELGDLLLHIVFYAQIASERGEFNFNQICEKISEKLERRHPHIFGNLEVKNTDDVLKNWEKIKQSERTQKGKASVLDDIPNTYPALMRAQKIQKRAQSVGFDWTTLSAVMAKIHEEIKEVLDEVEQEKVNAKKVEEEIGDLLFSVVNLSRHLGVEAENALQKANRKFERRFREVENLILTTSSLSLEEASLEQMEDAWQTVKRSDFHSEETDNINV